MNLFLHRIEDFDVVRGDTLANPTFLEGDRLRQFDVVLANPPYSIKRWDRGTWNENSRPYVLHKTADEILDSLRGYLERIVDSGH